MSRHKVNGRQILHREDYERLAGAMIREPALFVSAQRLAEIMEVDPNTIRAWVRAGCLPGADLRQRKIPLWWAAGLRLFAEGMAKKWKDGSA